MNALKWLKVSLVGFALVGLCVGTTSCRGRDQAQTDESEDVSEPERNLTFNNITLEQANDEGQLVWRMVADEAVYSQDRRVADIQNPSGEFFRDDESTIKIQAKTGEVRNDGEQIFLKGEVIATDVETGAILRGDEMEWRTGDDVIIIRKNIIGTHPDYTIAADEAQAFISEQRIDISGNIAAVSKEEDIQLEAEALTWMLDEETLISDRPIRLQQRRGRQIMGRAQGDRAEFNMAEETALLEQNALVIMRDPPIRVTGNSLQWNLASNQVNAREPFTVLHQEQKMTLSANQGTGNLDTQVFRMNGDVVVVAQQNQGRLTSNQLTWKIPTQDILAEGNVVYRQVDPVFNLRGERAEGKLENQTIVVSGGRVVTEIIPETIN